MKFPRGAKIFTGQFDPLPYVGVFLCLLIFMIFFRDMVLPSGVVVELPDMENAESIPPSRWRVVLDRDGKYYFEDGLWRREQLGEVLKMRLSDLKLSNSEKTVMLQADKMVSFQALNDAMALMREVGFKKVIQVGHTKSFQTEKIFSEPGRSLEKK